MLLRNLSLLPRTSNDLCLCHTDKGFRPQRFNPYPQAMTDKAGVPAGVSLGNGIPVRYNSTLDAATDQ